MSEDIGSNVKALMADKDDVPGEDGHLCLERLSKMLLKRQYEETGISQPSSPRPELWQTGAPHRAGKFKHVQGSLGSGWNGKWRICKGFKRWRQVRPINCLKHLPTLGT